MGNRPKCLLELDGIPLIQRQLMALSGAGVVEQVVVLGHHAARIQPVLSDFPVTRVCNPDPAAGQVSSLRLGLQSLSSSMDTVLVALADQPLIGAQDIVELLGAYCRRPDGTSLARADVDGQPGNPVVFSAEVCKEILNSEPAFGCRQWQEAHPDKVHRWISSNMHYCLDVDSPGDIELLAARTGHRLHWPMDLDVQR
jgi:molybdenum cofactor cytidylyltransferase